MMNAFDSRRDRAQLLLTVLGIAIALAVLPLTAGLLGALVLHVAAAPLRVGSPPTFRYALLPWSSSSPLRF